MSMKKDKFTYRVTWSEDDNEYVGLCAEFPSLSWLAKTPEKALNGIRKVVDDVVGICIKRVKPSPNRYRPVHYSGKFMVRVPPPGSSKTRHSAAEFGVSLIGLPVEIKSIKTDIQTTRIQHSEVSHGGFFNETQISETKCTEI